MAFRGGGRGRGRGRGGGGFGANKYVKPEPFVIFPVKSESLDIERFSDALEPKKKSNKSGSFYDFLVLRPDNFPKELLGDTRRDRPVKRAKWTPDTDLRKLDVFEKLEIKYGDDGKEVNGEAEDGEEVEESEGEDSDNGDYDQMKKYIKLLRLLPPKYQVLQTRPEATHVPGFSFRDQPKQYYINISTSNELSQFSFESESKRTLSKHIVHNL
ncbi:unnamed protein product [Thlaspi arvense]|uniref:DNA-directed RNA polymerase III subunit n=1 Tax=Thlaspi arvense TaxID=13288 RepID=A0AAU9SSM7_THLAR|nr:unnamed protein product [Thlaspi arvense]